MSNWMDGWLDRDVRFKLFGEWREGRVIECLHEVCTPYWVIAKFYEGPFTIKVGGPRQAFRRAKENTNV